MRFFFLGGFEKAYRSYLKDVDQGSGQGVP